MAPLWSVAWCVAQSRARVWCSETTWARDCGIHLRMGGAPSVQSSTKMAGRPAAAGTSSCGMPGSIPIRASTRARSTTAGGKRADRPGGKGERAASTHKNYTKAKKNTNKNTRQAYLVGLRLWAPTQWGAMTVAR